MWMTFGILIPLIVWPTLSHNRKLPRFHFFYWSPDSGDSDAFCYDRGSLSIRLFLGEREGGGREEGDWGGENNWLVPPVSLVPWVIRHLLECKAMGTLIVPKWASVTIDGHCCPSSYSISPRSWNL